MQHLPEFKAADLTRHTSELFDAAIRSPVAITKHRKPKFVKDFLGEGGSVAGAIRAYADAVRHGRFPAAEHAYA